MPTPRARRWKLGMDLAMCMATVAIIGGGLVVAVGVDFWAYFWPALVAMALLTVAAWASLEVWIRWEARARR